MVERMDERQVSMAERALYMSPLSATSTNRATPRHGLCWRNLTVPGLPGNGVC